MNQFVFGDYVITGVTNAFNSNTSWWISKRGYSVAHYCFSTSFSGAALAKELDYQLGNIKTYINMFNSKQNEKEQQ